MSLLFEAVEDSSGKNKGALTIGKRHIANDFAVVGKVFDDDPSARFDLHCRVFDNQFVADRARVVMMRLSR